MRTTGINDKLNEYIGDKFHRVGEMFYFQRGYFNASHSPHNKNFVEEISFENLKSDGIYSQLINHFSN
jgi:hypothetical protein